MIGTTTTEHFTSTDGDTYLWVRDGVAGVFLTAHPDRAAPFLTAFLT